MEPSGGVRDQEIESLAIRPRPSALRERHGVLCLAVEMDGHADRFPEDFQLVDRRGTSQIQGRQEHALSAILPEPRELARARGLPGALEPGHQHHARPIGRKLVSCRRSAAEHRYQLVEHDLDDLLAGRHALQYIRPDRALFHALAEIARHRQVHVRFQENSPDLPDRVAHILLAQPAPSGQLPEDPGQFRSQLVEHAGDDPFDPNGPSRDKRRKLPRSPRRGNPEAPPMPGFPRRYAEKMLTAPAV